MQHNINEMFKLLGLNFDIRNRNYAIEQKFFSKSLLNFFILLKFIHLKPIKYVFSESCADFFFKTAGSCTIIDPYDETFGYLR